MKKTHEDLLDSRIARFTQDMDRIAKDREGEGLKMKRTTVHFDYMGDDSNGLSVGMHISVDPRRLQPGEDGLGGDGTFLVRMYMSPNRFAALVSKLVEYAMGIGIEGECRDYPSIVIDEEMD